MKVSDHFDGKRFFNPGISGKELVSPSRILKYLLKHRVRWPKQAAHEVKCDLHQNLGAREIALTFVNHATFLIQLGGKNILTDPVWSMRASPLPWIGPARARPPGVKLGELPRIDLILISHNHYDHLDVATLKHLQRKFSPKVLVAAGDKRLVQSIGIENVEELDWWEEVRIGPELRVTFTPGQHFSGRGLFDAQKSLWGGYLIKHADRTVYFGGDAGYSRHFSAIRETFGPPDLALLGIGGYEPRHLMQAIHLSPEEAVRAHEDLGAKQSVGMHFGTFQLSAEAIDQPIQELKQALQRRRIAEKAFITLKEGETRVF